MKKIKILTSTLLGLSLLLSSCSDDYLDTEPTSSVSEQAAMSTADNLIAAINGMHRNMYSRQNSSQGQNGYTAQLIFSDVMGDDLIFPSTANGWFVSVIRWQHTNNESASDISYPWLFWYSMIKNSNNIITYGENASGDTNLKESAIGQAYAYRALSLFQLVQIYGKRYVAGEANANLGVIIRLDPTDIGPKARATVAEVYEQIWKDLDKAEELLDGKDQPNISHFSLGNVRGLKARVALVQQNYSKAAQYAELARTPFKLMSREEYKEGFNNYNNPEWMWGIKIVSDQTDYFGNFHAYMSRNYNSTQIRQAPKVMNVNLYNAFPNSDVRKELVDSTGEHASLKLPSNYSKFPYTSQKFLSQSFSISLGDVPFMRAAEMYLIEAEAKYKLGNEAGSKQILKELIQARDDEFSDFTKTGEEYYQEILLNRRLELWGEGFRFFDLKRLGLPLNRNDANQNATVISNLYTIEPHDVRWQWLIPRQEINSNSLIEQNPTQE